MEREERLIGWIETDSGTVSIGDPVKDEPPDWETLVTAFLDRDTSSTRTTRTRLVRTSIVHNTDDSRR